MLDRRWTTAVYCLIITIMSKRIHFIGVGGIGMSGLARLYLHEGAEVSGSDAVETDLTKKLESEGVAITYEQKAENIQSRLDLDLVVYTEAMTHDHPELVAAREKGIKTVNYFEALGEIANQYYLIAVAGTHGKTTTTAMLIDILEEASFDPTAIVGSLRTRTNSNYRAGKSKYFVVEACEYKRDFLTLQPDVLIITNLEHEHVDYYKDLTDVQSAFRELAEKVPADGVVIANLHEENLKPVVEGLPCEVIDYQEAFDPFLELPQPGLHNQMNAAAARSAAAWLGVEKPFILSALDNFAGTKRRFEYKGDCNNAPVYDDYAHHPTELMASIKATKEKYYTRKLTVVFQPHTYSRTQELFADFVTALSKADRVILVPIYAAREDDDGSVSSEKLVSTLAEQGIDASFYHTLEAAALEVKESVSAEDVVLVMGAGDVTKVSDLLTM